MAASTSGFNWRYVTVPGWILLGILLVAAQPEAAFAVGAVVLGALGLRQGL